MDASAFLKEAVSVVFSEMEMEPTDAVIEAASKALDLVAPALLAEAFALGFNEAKRQIVAALEKVQSPVSGEDSAHPEGGVSSAAKTASGIEVPPVERDQILGLALSPMASMMRACGEVMRFRAISAALQEDSGMRIFAEASEFAAELASIEPLAPDNISPDLGLLVSMATRINHDFGAPYAGTIDHRGEDVRAWQQARLEEMRSAWEEVVGVGYYRCESAHSYLGMIVPAAEASVSA